jgi:nucleobase:cation symporter-1, NCS1 family
MSTPTAERPVQADQVGHIEIRGIDPIPDSDAHGHPRELYWLWFTSNMTFFYILVGGLLVSLGMALWQALLVIALGGLSNFLVGLQAIPGPIARTPTMIISRAQYGIHGNRLSALLGWFNSVAFEAIGLSICSFTFFALAEFVGWSPGNAGKGLLVGIVTVIAFSVAIFGHATIVWFQRISAYLFLAVTVLLFIFVIPDVDWSYGPTPPLHASAAFALALVGITIVFSSNIAWAQSPSDFSRYLPRQTSRASVFLNTSLGILTASTILLVLGALAATAVDMSDPIVSLKALMPGWAYVFFLLVVLGVRGPTSSLVPIPPA